MTMDLSNLTPGPGGRKKRKRVGRGPSSGHGKTSGRGHKGQKARSGFSRRFGFEGGQMPLARRLPKRGFTHSSRHPYSEVNLDIVDAAFEDGAEVSAETLVAKGLVKNRPGGVKVLGRGDVTKKLNFKVSAISEGAKAKIESAGGSVEMTEAPAARAVTNRKRAKA